MSKSKNAHAEIDRIKHDYLEAYAERWGTMAAMQLAISYRKGWWYLTPSPVSTPYREKEIVAMTESLRKRTKQ